MNYLAHLHLSGLNKDVMLGNFIADGIRGQRYIDYPTGVQKGILMHRWIDHFTDHHPIVRLSKKRLFPSQGHYAPVVVDMMYDHYLAKNWNQFCNIPLEQYAQEFYTYLEQNSAILPKRILHLKPYLIQQNWLLTYATTEGLQRALKGMHNRTSHHSRMDTAVAEIVIDYDIYHSEFNAFYKSLTSQVLKKWPDLK